MSTFFFFLSLFLFVRYLCRLLLWKSLMFRANEENEKKSAFLFERPFNTEIGAFQRHFTSIEIMALNKWYIFDSLLCFSIPTANGNIHAWKENEHFEIRDSVNSSKSWSFLIKLCRLEILESGSSTFKYLIETPQCMQPFDRFGFPVYVFTLQYKLIHFT